MANHTNERQLYLAYGSNLNLRQMAKRCPRARPLRGAMLRGWSLAFRGVADIDRKEGGILAGGLWDISKGCELSLDAYEGVRSGLYRKEYLRIPSCGERPVLVYIMNGGYVAPPCEQYLDGIREGYRHFGLRTETLELAVAESLERAKERAPALEEEWEEWLDPFRLDDDGPGSRPWPSLFLPDVPDPLTEGRKVAKRK